MTPDDIFQPRTPSKLSSSVTFSRTLIFFRFLEYLTGIFLAAIILTADNNNWGILAIILLYVALNGVFLVVALWALVFRPGQRIAALKVLLLPFAFLVVPLLVRDVIGGPVSAEFIYTVLALLMVSGIGWVILRPAQAAEYMPVGLLRSRPFNCSLLILLALGWVLPVIAIAYIVGQGGGIGGGQGSPGMGTAYILILFALYFIGLGVVSLLIALWGWLGLRTNSAVSERKFHVWQLVAATPGLLMGIVIAVMLAYKGVITLSN